MQPSVGCMGIFVRSGTRSNLHDVSGSGATRVKIPAQPTDGWEPALSGVEGATLACIDYSNAWPIVLPELHYFSQWILISW